MRQQDEQYVKSMEEWLLSQDLIIESCDINIAFYEKAKAHLQKQIDQEWKEKAEKITLKEIVQENLEKFKRDTAELND